jgi:hypothetical protein
VRRWILTKNALEKTSQNRQSFRGKKAKFPELENKLLRYVRNTREMIQFEGQKIADRMKIPRNEFKESYANHHVGNNVVCKIYR